VTLRAADRAKPFLCWVVRMDIVTDTPIASFSFHRVSLTAHGCLGQMLLPNNTYLVYGVPASGTVLGTAHCLIDISSMADCIGYSVPRLFAGNIWKPTFFLPTLAWTKTGGF
jgi:hypothetical protein